MNILLDGLSGGLFGKRLGIGVERTIETQKVRIFRKCLTSTPMNDTTVSPLSCTRRYCAQIEETNEQILWKEIEKFDNIKTRGTGATRVMAPGPHCGSTLEVIPLNHFDVQTGQRIGAIG